jgi:hemoglobin/transferrin/lactoferrin receptor protein
VKVSIFLLIFTSFLLNHLNPDQIQPIMRPFIFILLWVLPMYAQAQELPDTLNDHLRLNEVIVAATRWNQNSSDIPLKVINITDEEISIRNPQTMADLLNISGNVFIQKSQQGGGSPMIRGFATNRLLYSVDGIRMNTAIFRAGNIQNVISLDPFALESTQVLFGPGSVIYGSDAIGGVMSFQTLAPIYSTSLQPAAKGRAITRYSSANNEQTGHFDIQCGWKKWSYVSSFSSFDYGDLLMGSYGPDEYLQKFYVERFNNSDQVISNENPRLQRPTGYTQINLMQKLAFKPSENWEIQYGFHYSETSEYSRYDRLIRYRDGFPRYGEWNYGPQKWMMNNLFINHKGNNKAYDEASFKVALQNFEESRISRNIYEPDREIRREKVNAYSANLDFTKKIGPKNQFFYGIEAVSDGVTSIGVNENIDSDTSMAGPSRYPQAVWNSFGAYLTDQYKINEYFLISAGLRYSQYLINADFDSTFYPFPFKTANINNGGLTGSMGMVYRPEESWVISANVATAFRSPNVDDLGKVFDSEPGSVTVPNPDLEAEYAYNFDLGVTKVLWGIVKIDVAVYYTFLRNALVRRNFIINGMDSIIYDGTLSQVQAVQNAASAFVYGAQAGLEIKLPSGFGITSDFNFQKGKEELDDASTSPSRHAAPNFGTTVVSYKKDRMNLQFYAVYSGGKSFEDLPEEEKGKTEIYAIDVDGNPYSPAWYTLNLKALYQITKNFSISAGVENLTDQRYRPYSSGICAPGRNFVISLRADF